MHFGDYQDMAQETAIYPGRYAETGLYYAVLGLVGEAGELANKTKKVIRDGNDPNVTAAELGDVLWYVAMVAEESDLSLEDVARANLDKLSDRQKRNMLGGSGDYR